MKKFISCFCLSIFICINILKPIQLYAFNELDTYVEDEVTVEEAKEYIGHTLLGLALASGAELVVPGSGETVAEITDKIWDVIDFSDELYQWCLDMSRKWDEGEINWQDVTGGIISEEIVRVNNTSPMELALQVLLDNWNNETEEIIPEPNVNYLPYIQLINGSSFNYSYLQTDNWFVNTSNNGLSSSYTFTDSKSSVSYYTTSINHTFTVGNFNSSGASDWYVAKMLLGNYDLSAYTYSPISIYINNVNGTYQCTTSTIIPKSILKNGNTLYYGLECNYKVSQNKWDMIANLKTQPYNLSWSYSDQNLENCFKMISMVFRNVNIYVDGSPWSIVTAPPEPVKLGGNTYITGTTTPIRYDFPEGTKFNPNILASILRQLIDLNNTGNAITIQIDDILDSFTDEYGVTAQYVINFVRNDYDQLIIEQYGNNRLTHNKGLLFPKTDLQPYTETSTYITQSSISLIPNDILSILGACGILILIAYLINRLLE